MKVLAVTFALSALLSALHSGTASAASRSEGVDWKEQVIRATGSGAPDLKAANPAQARLAAEKAAQLDAFRNLLSQVKGIEVSAGKHVSDVMGDSDEIRAQVEGTLRGFRTVHKKYFSDSGVELEVEVPLSQLTELLPPPEPESTPKDMPSKKSASPSKYSSLVVDATGLHATSALAPRLLDPKGQVVFSAENVEKSARKDGVAHYTRSLDEAKKSSWAGEHPLVLKATAAKGSDVVLSDSDVHALIESADPTYFRTGRVIIVAP